MTYADLLEIMDALEGELKDYIKMLHTDKKIIINRDFYPAICKPNEIAENYIEAIQEIEVDLKEVIMVAKIVNQGRID